MALEEGAGPYSINIEFLKAESALVAVVCLLQQLKVLKTDLSEASLRHHFHGYIYSIIGVPAFIKQ